MSESEVKVKPTELELELERRIWKNRCSNHELERRVIALERGLEAVLRKMEASGQADDEPGWYGRPE